MAKRVSERSVIDNAPPLSGKAGLKKGNRVYLCVGPYCWGRGLTAAEAVKNAKANRARVYEGKRGWAFVLFDVDSSTTVDGMGMFSYVPRKGVEPYIEIARFNTVKPEGKK